MIGIHNMELLQEEVEENNENLASIVQALRKSGDNYNIRVEDGTPLQEFLAFVHPSEFNIHAYKTLYNDILQQKGLEPITEQEAGQLMGKFNFYTWQKTGAWNDYMHALQCSMFPGQVHDPFVHDSIETLLRLPGQTSQDKELKEANKEIYEIQEKLAQAPSVNILDKFFNTSRYKRREEEYNKYMPLLQKILETLNNPLKNFGHEYRHEYAKHFSSSNFS